MYRLKLEDGGLIIRQITLACWQCRYLAAAVLLWLAPLTSVWACHGPLTSALEELYCQLQARGALGGLPNFAEFQRNPAATQALMLKRPAQRTPSL